MFWPIIPIMTVTGMQVVIQPLPSSIWKLPFHAIKVMEIGPACQLFFYDGGTFQHGNAFIQSSDDGSHLEIFSIHLDRRQQHTDLEFWAVAHLIVHVFRILKLSWYVCYHQLLINVVDLSETYAIREIILLCICHE